MMILRPVFMGVLGSCIMAGSAFALSCAPPDLAQTMENAKSSDKTYYIFVGRFQPAHQRAQSVQPKPAYQRPTATRTRMIFNGRALGRYPNWDSYLSSYPLDVQTSCAGPWCSSPPSDTGEKIAFVEAAPGHMPVLRVSPCPTWMFNLEPQTGQIDLLRSCMDRPCKARRRTYR